MNIFCEQCEYHYADREHIINAKYLDPKGGCTVIKMDGGGGLGIECCQHPICFKQDIIHNIISGTATSKIRIAGNAQLNKNMDCIYFKKKINLKDWLFNLFSKIKSKNN